MWSSRGRRRKASRRKKATIPSNFLEEEERYQESFPLFENSYCSERNFTGSCAQCYKQFLAAHFGPHLLMAM